MLFEAAFWYPDQPRPGVEEGLARPDLAHLLADWGRPGDTAVIAYDGATDLGAAWFRSWSDEEHSYGYVAATIPELAIGVVGAHRRRGVGRALLRALRQRAVQQDIRALSLSVEEANPAVRLYLSEGYERVSTVENSWTMVLHIAP